MEPTHIEHPLEPIFDARSRVLVLGTMPSPKSREAGFYYAHPQNRFWKVMAALFEEPEPLGNEARAAFMLERRVALWDVLASCTIEGASDASISNARPNDLSRIGLAAPLEAVFTTGSKATGLYRRFCAGMLPGVPHVGLPSTSPANARMRLADLVEAYRPLGTRCAEAPEPRRVGLRNRGSADVPTVVLPPPPAPSRAGEAADAGRRQTGVVACERSYFSAFSGWPWSFCQRSQVE